MENDRKRKLYVTGPQGCGKTCFLWMWANMLMNHGKRVLVIRYRPALAQHIWILEAGETKLMTTGYDLAKVVSKLLRAQTKQFDVCICIGVRTTELDTLRELMTELNVVVESAKQPDAKIAKLVYETTLDFRVVEGDEMTGKDSIVEKMWMESRQSYLI
jgi:signal recognition particle GTPase